MSDHYIKSYRSFNTEKPFKKKRGFFIFGLFKDKKNKKVFSKEPSGSVPRMNKFNNFSRNDTPKKRMSKNWKGIFVSVFLFLLLLTWAILILYLPYFRVNSVEFVGLKIIEQQEISDYFHEKYFKSSILPKNNYFWVKAKNIERGIFEKYSVDSVKVNKIFPNKIVIEIQEKISTIIYYAGDKYYLLDKNGEVVKRIFIDNNENNRVLIEDQINDPNDNVDPLSESSTEKPSTTAGVQNNSASTTIINDESNTESVSSSASIIVSNNIVDNPNWRKLRREYEDIPILHIKDNSINLFEQDVLVPNNIIEFIINFSSRIEEEGIGEIRYFETDNINAGLTVVIDKAWKIYVQPKNSLEEQIHNLKIILSSRDANPNKYIDLRFGERVFWK